MQCAKHILRERSDLRQTQTHANSKYMKNRFIVLTNFIKSQGKTEKQVCLFKNQKRKTKLGKIATVYYNNLNKFLLWN